MTWGGITNFGPVLPEVDEPVFHEDWERRIFAMNMAGLAYIGPIDRARLWASTAAVSRTRRRRSFVMTARRRILHLSMRAEGLDCTADQASHPQQRRHEPGESDRPSNCFSVVPNRRHRPLRRHSDGNAHRTAVYPVATRHSASQRRV